MLIEAIRNIPSTKKDLRNFGVVMGVALGLIGGLLLWKRSDLHVVFFACAAAMVMLGTAAPIVLLPLQKGWMLLSGLLGWIISRIILTALFYVVLTPMGLAARLFGKRFLNTRFDKAADTYWTPRQESPESERKTHYEEQF